MTHASSRLAIPKRTVTEGPGAARRATVAPPGGPGHIEGHRLPDDTELRPGELVGPGPDGVAAAHHPIGDLGRAQGQAPATGAVTCPVTTTPRGSGTGLQGEQAPGHRDQQDRRQQTQPARREDVPYPRR